MSCDILDNILISGKWDKHSSAYVFHPFMDVFQSVLNSNDNNNNNNNNLSCYFFNFFILLYVMSGNQFADVLLLILLFCKQKFWLTFLPFFSCIHHILSAFFVLLRQYGQRWLYYICLEINPCIFWNRK